MKINLAFILTKIISKLSRIYGGGSALPGLILEKLAPDFTKTKLSQLKYGVVVISGTNGKTSTTKILAQILTDQGLKVFTNDTGSNFFRGVSSALIQQSNFKGELAADIAVIELDEAHAVHFVKQIKPTYSLLLNVLRDQLDRYAELDNVQRMLTKIAQATATTVVLNRQDSRIAHISSQIDNFQFYGYDPKLDVKLTTIDKQKSPSSDFKPLVLMKDHQNNQATFSVKNQELTVNFKLDGIYNHYNAAGAIATAAVILGDKLDYQQLKTSLENIQPASGRGERFYYNNQPIDLILVKNPTGFQLALKSFLNESSKLMLAINDAYADGRDVSWLWDVDFQDLQSGQVFITTGSRCYDMSLRLKYDDKKAEHAEESLTVALNKFINSHPDQPKQIYATYTAMTKIRKRLQKLTKKKGRDAAKN